MSVDFDRQLFCFWTDFCQTFRDFFHPIKSEDIKFSVEGAPFGEFNGKLKILLQISHPLIILGALQPKFDREGQAQLNFGNVQAANLVTKIIL